MSISLKTTKFCAKPFIKWAGGKTQLLPKLEERLPEHIRSSRMIERYVEPFIGGGAFFFYLKSNYDIKKSYIFDVNSELIISYTAIKRNPQNLIDMLDKIQSEYFDLSENKREKYFYDLRNKYNDDIGSFNCKKYDKTWIERASLLIFLNRTCFNGLFRQNSKGEFNVPFGDYKNPKICDEHNIMSVHECLKDTTIICGDFTRSKRYIDNNTFVYLDPPYRPIKATSSFTSYAKEDFNDDDQIRLAKFYKAMNDKGAYLMLSNSDPKNEDKDDNFFDDLYNGFNIDRVLASRMINCDKYGRGKISELVITNWHCKK